jgi:hypothetical protein
MEAVNRLNLDWKDFGTAMILAMIEKMNGIAWV